MKFNRSHSTSIGSILLNELKSILLYDFFFFFDHTHKMWKFPGQGLNPCHSSDNARSLTNRPPGNSYYDQILKTGPYPGALG